MASKALLLELCFIFHVLSIKLIGKDIPRHGGRDATQMGYTLPNFFPSNALHVTELKLRLRSTDQAAFEDNLECLTIKKITKTTLLLKVALAG